MTYLTTAHEVQDQAKVVEIAASMSANGWVGAPVVVWDETNQLTGVHRAAAAEIAGIEMETIELSEIFEEDGADFDAAVAEYQDHPNPCVFDGFKVCVMPYLSDDIKAKYGIDFH